MPDKDAPEVLHAGGKVSSSALMRIHLIPTEAIIRLVKRFELGEERKKERAWNAMSQNQEVLVAKDFIYSRIDHIINHAFRLRDKIVRGEPLLDGDDDAGAIIWGGAFLCCATAAIDKPPRVCSGCGGYKVVPLPTGEPRVMICFNCHGSHRDDPKCFVCHGLLFVATCPMCKGSGTLPPK